MDVLRRLEVKEGRGHETVEVEEEEEEEEQVEESLSKFRLVV